MVIKLQLPVLMMTQQDLLYYEEGRKLITNYTIDQEIKGRRNEEEERKREKVALL